MGEDKKPRKPDEGEELNTADLSDLPQEVVPPPPPKEEKRKPRNLFAEPDDFLLSDIDEPVIEPVSKDDDPIASVIGRVKARVKEKAAESKDGKPASKKSSKAKETTKAAAPSSKEQADLVDAARMMVSPVLILAVTNALGENCAPTKEEADAFVEPLARIIARHVPVPDYLSADLIDILGMFSAVLVWYSRVSPDLPWNKGGGQGRGPRDNGRGPVGGVSVEQTADGSEEYAFDPDEFLYGKEAR